MSSLNPISPTTTTVSAGRRAWPRVACDGDVAAEYAYDPNGNRLARTTPEGATAGTYDAQDRLVSYGSLAFEHVHSGELRGRTDTARGETTTYIYDAFGNLRSVGLPDGRLVEYEVDGLGRRVGKRVDGVLMRAWIYGDRLRPAAQLDGNGNVVARFVYATRRNVPDYMAKGGSTYRLITDHLGSVRLVVDAATGATFQELTYDEFGRVLEDTNPGLQPFGFAGGLYDGMTTFVRFGARDYYPAIGRWVAKDPKPLAPRALNFSAYVYNDPLNTTDRTGFGKQLACLESCEEQFEKYLAYCNYVMGAGCMAFCLKAPDKFKCVLVCAAAQAACQLSVAAHFTICAAMCPDDECSE
ncbi:MAG: hypothetical protein HY744_14990 [Deltaproteobacteria bacterium]|nr:hypothetical protein [Deltaproteobacteria bacterium]